MIHRTLQYPAGWEWHMLQQPRTYAESQEPLPKRRGDPGQSPPRKLSERTREEAEEELLALKRKLPECASWLDQCSERVANRITAARLPEGGPCVYGTIIFQVSDKQNDLQPFHFWATKNRLVTLQSDLRLSVRLQADEHAMLLEESGAAPEALLEIVGVMLQPFQAGLDGFESRLGQLERSMRYRNRTVLIDVIFERRYELLHWSHLFIPIREVHGALKEAFTERITDTEAFKRITAKLDRIDMLLKHYALEMDTLIAMDDAISSFRGNDIMKTLTIFTALFTPATVAGAIWGMNFEWMPWLHEPWGFASLTVVVVVFTLAIYAWFRQKGWTGDLLHGRRREISTQGRKKRKKRKKRRSAKRRGASYAKLPEAAAPGAEGPLPSRTSRK